MNYVELMQSIKSLEARTLREEISQQKLEEDLRATEAELLALGGFPSRAEAEAHLAEVKEKVSSLKSRADSIATRLEELQGSALHLV